MNDSFDAANPAFKPDRPTVIVIGGGFGGIQAVRHLRGADANVLLLDRHNYHLFQPLLYQVATSVLTPSEIAFPLRRIFAGQKNTTTALCAVEAIDPRRKVIRSGDYEVPFDHLVLATGAVTNYFGRDDWEKATTGLKTLGDAVDVRNKVLAAFERAEVAHDPASMERELTFLIVGAGATGVELSGAIKELAVDSLCRDFRAVNTQSARVILVDGGDRPLKGFSKPLSDYTLQTLKNKGVEVELNTEVVNVTRELVTIKDGSGNEQEIHAGNVIWAAGVKGSPLGKQLIEAAGLQQRKDGRVDVQPDLSIPGHPDIFVIGDLAAVWDERLNGEVPGVATAAIQMGSYVGKTIARRLRSGSETSAAKPFKYLDKGSMATIGRAKAVMESGRFHLTGFLAWLAWGILHIMYLVGFRNRLVTMFSWLVTYISYTKGSRLITDKISAEAQLPPGIGARTQQSEQVLKSSEA